MLDGLEGQLNTPIQCTSVTLHVEAPELPGAWGCLACNVQHMLFCLQKVSVKPG